MCIVSKQEEEKGEVHPRVCLLAELCRNTTAINGKLEEVVRWGPALKATEIPKLHTIRHSTMEQQVDKTIMNLVFDNTKTPN